MERPPTDLNPRINPWLDLVRSLAILLVLFRHGEQALANAGREPSGFLDVFFRNGWIGVDLFFVLSGYLIARHLISAGVDSGRFSLSRYLATRGLRIIPAYFAVIALILVGAFPLYVIPSDLLLFRVIYHAFFMQDYLPSNINVVFWSLGVEEKFYLLAPLLLLGLLRLRSRALQGMLLLALFLIPVVCRAESFLRAPAGLEYVQFFYIFRSPFHMTLEGLMVGVALAVAQHAGLIRTSRRAGFVIMFLSIAVLFTWLASHDFMAELGAFDAIVQPSLIALLAGLLTLGAIQLGKTRMPFARPVNMLARLSYSLYLIHFPLIPFVVAVAAPKGVMVFWAFYLISSMLAAFLLYLLVERPFLLLKDRISDRGMDRSGKDATARSPKELITNAP